MAFTIRRMHAGDEPQFDSIAIDVFDEPIHPGRLSHYLRVPGHMMVLAIEDGVVVGQCAAVVHHHPDKPDELYIDEVGTATEHLRRGIATAMLTEMFAWGRELGCTEAWLGTELDNDAANALYRSFAPAEDEAIRYYLFKL